MSSIFNDPEWEQQRKEILTNWARRDGEVKVDMGETEEYMPAEEFLALRQKYPNGNMRLSEPQEAMKVFKDKGLPLPAELSFAGSVKPIFGQEDAYNGSTSFPAEAFNFPASANEGYQSGLGFSPVISAMQMPEGERANIRLKTRDDLEPMYESYWSDPIRKAHRVVDFGFSVLPRALTDVVNIIDHYGFLNTIKNTAKNGYKTYLLMDKLSKEQAPLKKNDKLKHFSLSCNGTRSDPLTALLLEYGKEGIDQWKESNTFSESNKDLDADSFGNYWGTFHKDKSCEEGERVYEQILKMTGQIK